VARLKHEDLVSKPWFVVNAVLFSRCRRDQLRARSSARAYAREAEHAHVRKVVRTPGMPCLKFAGYFLEFSRVPVRPVDRCMRPGRGASEGL